MSQRVRRLFLPTLAILLLVSACTTPTTPTTQTPAIDLSKPETVLRAIPDLTIQFPSSLKGADQTTTAARAVGDISAVDAASLPSIKSQGWYNMRSMTDFSKGEEMAVLGILKNYAASNTIPLDQTFSIGSISFYPGVPQLVTLADGGRVLAHVSGNALYLTWYIKLDLNTVNSQIPAGTDATFKCLFKITNGSGGITLWSRVERYVPAGIPGMTGTLVLYAKYDQATHSLFRADTSDPSYYFYTDSDPSAGWIRYYVNRSSPQYENFGYGSASEGAVASASVSSSTYFADYFDADGQLLLTTNVTGQSGDSLATLMTTQGYSSYPLKVLLPLVSPYSSATLQRVEGQASSFNWTDWTNVSHTTSYTADSYFIDIDNSGGQGNGEPSVPIVQSPVFHWDSVAKQYSAQYGTFIQTNPSTTSLPQGFAFSKSAVVTDAQAKLAETQAFGAAIDRSAIVSAIDTDNASAPYDQVLY